MLIMIKNKQTQVYVINNQVPLSIYLGYGLFRYEMYPGVLCGIVLAHSGGGRLPVDWGPCIQFLLFLN